LILSRLADNLKPANWGALTLELLVMAVGGYAAFQLESWGENWKASRQEKIYLL